jgi:hypothetical protein
MVDATPERQEHGCLRPADVAQLATTALTLPRSEAELVDAMHALVQLDRVTGRRRERLAISAVLDHGWSYSRLAEVYGVTRQGAHKTYAAAVAAELAIEGKHGDGAGILLDAGEVAELIAALRTAGGAR